MHRGSHFAIIRKQGYVLAQPSAGLPWVLRIAQEHWDRTFHHARSGHESCFIAYVQDGRLVLGEGPERMEAGPGNVVYLAQEPRTRALSVASAPGVRLIVAVIRGKAGVDVVASYLGPVTCLLAPGDSVLVESLFQCMLRAAGRSYPVASDITARLLLPTLQTIRQEHDHAHAAGDPSHGLFARCRECIAHDYLAIGSVAAVARQFGTTHARLCRLFRRYEGCSPHRFLLQRKMTHAVHELQQRGRSVGEVGYELGFADPYSFSKAFKRVIGYSPSFARSGRRTG